MQRSHPRRGASPSTFLISSQMVDPTRVRKFSTSLRAHTYVSFLLVVSFETLLHASPMMTYPP